MQKLILTSLVALLSISQLFSTNAPIWSRIELKVNHPVHYDNPFQDVDLFIKVIRPDGSHFKLCGFFDHEGFWKFRIMPDQIGKWKYTAWFSDNSDKRISGSFRCVPSDIPGLIAADETNPVWFGFKGGKHQLIRSFHVGDRFFADNWPDSERKKFLDWLVENKYNTISVASHLLNRNAENRGKGWNTPDLWNAEKQQPNPEEYAKMEQILDELASRKIVVFPFAGFFGQKSNYPTDRLNQALYVRYTISRLGAYWNILYSVAGPEPLYRNVKQFTKDQVDKLGEMIAAQNTQGHLITVHNEKNNNPFIDASWASYQCLQGPTTLDLDSLYQGLMSRRNPHQPVLAQEVLWYGNIYQQTYNDEQLRKNAFTIMMAGAALNFADNSGTSSTGFTGTLNLAERHQDKHEIVKKVWDFFESIPFYELTPSQNQSNNGFSLSKPGETYLTYLPHGGEVTLITKPGNYLGVWIKGSDTNVRVNIGITNGQNLHAPSGEDWLLYLRTVNFDAALEPMSMPVFAGLGSYPGITADENGTLHIVYARNEKLYYRNFSPKKNQLSPEIFTTLTYPPDKYLGPNRSDPEIKVELGGRIHVFVGQQYASSIGNEWIKTDPDVTRDTDMAVNSKGDVFINKRGGNHNGQIGIQMKKAGSDQFNPTETDPDIGTKNGMEWLGKGDHVYGSIFVDAKDVIHVLYRQAQPEYVSYRRSEDNGKTWKGCGVYGGDQWQGEAADIAVTPSGKVMVISHDGVLYTLDEATFKFTETAKMISCKERDLPSISSGENDLVYVTAFGGKYNSFHNGKPEIEKIIPSILGKSIGFTENVVVGNVGWGIYEEGETVSNTEIEGNSAIFLIPLPK